MRFFCLLLRENGCSAVHSEGRNGVLRRLFILGIEGGRPEYISSLQYRRCRGSTQQTILPCPPLPPPHTKQSSSWAVRLQDTPHTLSIRHGGVPRQKTHVRTASARRTRRVRGAPTVAVASPNRRFWGFWRGGGRMPSESKATNVGLSQRVYIIGETCLNSFNRPQTAV